jgi:hypothetical protein
MWGVYAAVLFLIGLASPSVQVGRGHDDHFDTGKGLANRSDSVAAAEESNPKFFEDAEQTLRQGEEAERENRLSEAGQAYVRGLAILDQAGIRDNFTPTSRPAELYVFLAGKHLNTLITMADGVWKTVFEHPERLEEMPDPRGLVAEAITAYQNVVDFLETLEAKYPRIQAALDTIGEPPPGERLYTQGMLINSYFSLGSLATMVGDAALTEQCVRKLRSAGRNEAADRLLKLSVQNKQIQNGSSLSSWIVRLGGSEAKL